MDAQELRILRTDKIKLRERREEQRNRLLSAAATHKAEADEPHHTPFARRVIRKQEVDARDAVQRLDTEIYQLGCAIRSMGHEIARLENAADLKADHDEFFGRVRQIVAVSNVVPLPFASNSPEVA